MRRTTDADDPQHDTAVLDAVTTVITVCQTYRDRFHLAAGQSLQRREALAYLRTRFTAEEIRALIRARAGRDLLTRPRISQLAPKSPRTTEESS